MRIQLDWLKEYVDIDVSAEEVETEHNTLDRCLVLSTGINLSPAQINIG